MASLRRMGGVVALAVLLALVFAAPGVAGDRVRSGSVSVEGWRLSFIGSVGGANGTLEYGGRSHAFRVGGLGIGGFGISSFQAKGSVFDMAKLDDFVGTYVNLRSGITVGDESMGKSLWIQNEKGVTLELKAETQGLQLNLGADGLVVTWDD
jgi:hypothetical protein